MPRKTRRSHSRSRSQRKRGGAAYSLMGAPLDYAMTPGSPYTVDPAVGVYDRFPIDPTVNPQMVSDLDVYFGSALSQGCGTENSSLVVPADMGSNQVGGKRGNRRRHSRKHGAGLFDGIMDKMSSAGSSVGDFAQMASSHPYLGSAFPNTAQSLTNTWQGKLDSIPTSSDPTNHTWKMATEVTRNPINMSEYVNTMGDASQLMTPFTQAAAGAAQAGGRRKTLVRHSRSRSKRGHSRSHSSRTRRIAKRSHSRKRR